MDDARAGRKGLPLPTGTRSWSSAGGSPPVIDDMMTQKNDHGPCRWHFFAGREFDKCPDCGWSGRKARTGE